jgi:RNA polymerase sigma-B factor
MRYFDDMTQAQIAAQIGVSQMQISRLLIRTLTQLRTGMLTEQPPPTTHRPAPDQPAAQHGSADTRGQTPCGRGCRTAPPNRPDQRSRRNHRDA